MTLKELINSIRQLPKSKKWKKDILERDKHKCVVCGAVEDLQVHHKVKILDIMMRFNIESIEKAKRCKLIWDTSNGETLCTKCHKEQHE